MDAALAEFRDAVYGRDVGEWSPGVPPTSGCAVPALRGAARVMYRPVAGWTCVAVSPPGGNPYTLQSQLDALVAIAATLGGAGKSGPEARLLLRSPAALRGLLRGVCEFNGQRIALDVPSLALVFGEGAAPSKFSRAAGLAEVRAALSHAGWVLDADGVHEGESLGSTILHGLGITHAQAGPAHGPLKAPAGSLLPGALARDSSASLAMAFAVPQGSLQASAYRPLAREGSGRASSAAGSSRAPSAYGSTRAGGGRPRSQVGAGSAAGRPPIPGRPASPSPAGPRARAPSAGESSASSSEAWAGPRGEGRGGRAGGPGVPRLSLPGGAGSSGGPGLDPFAGAGAAGTGATSPGDGGDVFAVLDGASTPASGAATPALGGGAGGRAPELEDPWGGGASDPDDPFGGGGGEDGPGDDPLGAALEAAAPAGATPGAAGGGAAPGADWAAALGGGAASPGAAGAGCGRAGPRPGDAWLHVCETWRAEFRGTALVRQGLGGEVLCEAGPAPPPGGAGASAVPMFVLAGLHDLSRRGQLWDLRASPLHVSSGFSAGAFLVAPRGLARRPHETDAGPRGPPGGRGRVAPASALCAAGAGGSPVMRYGVACRGLAPPAALSVTCRVEDARAGATPGRFRATVSVAVRLAASPELPGVLRGVRVSASLPGATEVVAVAPRGLVARGAGGPGAPAVVQWQLGDAVAVPGGRGAVFRVRGVTGETDRDGMRRWLGGVRAHAEAARAAGDGRAAGTWSGGALGAPAGGALPAGWSAGVSLVELFASVG